MKKMIMNVACAIMMVAGMTGCFYIMTGEPIVSVIGAGLSAIFSVVFQMIDLVDEEEMA